MPRALILLIVLAFPALASLSYFYSGARMEWVETEHAVPLKPAAPSNDEAPPPEWREWSYLAANPDVADAVRSGGVSSGYQHYLKFGKAEGRAGGFSPEKRKGKTAARPQPAPPPPAATPAPVPTLAKEEPIPPEWREASYLAANPDVAEAVRNGAISSGHQHFVKYGKAEGRSGGFPPERPKAETKLSEAKAPPPVPPLAPAPSPAPVAVPAIVPAIVPPPAVPAIKPPPPPLAKPSPPLSSPTPLTTTPATATPATVAEPPPPPAPVGAPAIVPAIVPPPAALAAKPAPSPTPPPTVIAKNDAASVGTSASVTGVRFGRHEGFVRMVLDATAPLEHRIAFADDGRTAIITLPRAAWRGAEAGKISGAPPLINFEVKDANGSEPRLILHAAKTTIVRFAGKFLPSPGAGHRLVVDLAEK